jgi:hypothetical protein
MANDEGHPKPWIKTRRSKPRRELPMIRFHSHGFLRGRFFIISQISWSGAEEGMTRRPSRTKSFIPFISEAAD